MVVENKLNYTTLIQADVSFAESMFGMKDKWKQCVEYGFHPAMALAALLDHRYRKRVKEGPGLDQDLMTRWVRSSSCWLIARANSAAWQQSIS